MDKSCLLYTSTTATIHSRPERVNGHIGTETRPRLLREAAVGNIAQWEMCIRDSDDSGDYDGSDDGGSDDGGDGCLDDGLLN